ncbi:MAG TPA: helicase-associated domain-containing protein [Bacillota bacterium]|nr:helicase-associated domain-containing protein [Bacillota bacterium]
MLKRQDYPLIVQSDRTLLLEVEHPLFEEVRQAISPFSELIKSPEYIHTYRITPLSIWNACSLGMDAEMICLPLMKYSKYGVADQLLTGIREYVARYGLLKIEKQRDQLWLTSKDSNVLTDILRFRDILKWVGEERTEKGVVIDSYARGIIKQELIRLGYPIQDLAGYSNGTQLEMSLQETTLRPYQQGAMNSFYCNGSLYGGNGVLVLPCGAGKTVIGIATMVKVGMETLILTTNVTSVRQWMKEILQRTNLTNGEVGEFTGECKEIKPVTVSTYQMLTFKKNQNFHHINLFNERNWGLIIYDEVHLLPAPVFRLTADIQAKRRLGLTASLIREDGREEEVFTLVGPKKYDIPWRDLEKDGWIAQATCAEVRVPMDFSLREEYAYSNSRQKFRVAAENPEKKQIINLNYS